MSHYLSINGQIIGVDSQNLEELVAKMATKVGDGFPKALSQY